MARTKRLHSVQRRPNHVVIHTAQPGFKAAVFIPRGVKANLRDKTQLGVNARGYLFEVLREIVDDTVSLDGVGVEFLALQFIRPDGCTCSESCLYCYGGAHKKCKEPTCRITE